MTKVTMFVIMAIVMMATLSTGCDTDKDGNLCADDASDCDSDSDTDGDSDTDSDTDTDTDSDTDTDTDSDTDSDSDSDTDTDTDTDGDPCSLLNTESPDDESYDISGDWYEGGYHDTAHLLTVILAAAGEQCQVDSTGEEQFYYTLLGTEVPLEMYNSEDDQHLLVERADSDQPVLHVKFWGTGLNGDLYFTR